MQALSERWALVTLFACVAATLLSHARLARADGLEISNPSPRSIGRAGASAVSEDGGAALYINPAGMARRDGTRAQFGVLLLDRDLVYQPRDPYSRAAPGSHDRGSVVAAPHVAFETNLGPVVVGLAYLETSAVASRLAEPRALQTSSEIVEHYGHRYAGLAFEHRARTLFAGAAMRVKPWLGVGVSLGVARLSLRDKRHVWAGASARDAFPDPTRDLILELQGADPAVPRATAGVLLAPLSLPLEMAVSVSVAADAAITGSAHLTPLYETGPVTAVESDVTASVSLEQPTIVRSGIRYLGDRVSAELGADLVLYAQDQPSVVALAGLSVIDASGAGATLTRVDSLARARSHATVRAAVDFDVVPGFLWVTAGYARDSGASQEAWFSPVLASPSEHTVAFGVEGFVGAMSVHLGYARSLATTVDIATSHARVANPFESAASAITGQGVYQVSSDRVGVALDVAWE